MKYTNAFKGGYSSVMGNFIVSNPFYQYPIDSGQSALANTWKRVGNYINMECKKYEQSQKAFPQRKTRHPVATVNTVR
jgi:hypothetical protein